LPQLAQKALGEKTTDCSENTTPIESAPKLNQKFPEVVVRSFKCRVDVAVSIYPKAEFILGFPERVYLVAVDGKGTKNPEDFFLLSSQGELIGFIFKLPNNLFLGLYLLETEEANSESHQRQLSLILLTFSSQQENGKTKSLDSCSLENLSALLHLACKSFGVKLKRHDLGMCFCLIDQLRGQATNLSLSVISRNQKTKPARVKIPLKEREIQNHASLKSLSTLADLLRISCDVLRQLSQSSQENSGVLQHSSSELTTNNPSWKGQTEINKTKSRAKSAAGSRQTKPKAIKHLINEIGRLSAQVGELLKQSKGTKKLKLGIRSRKMAA
jgi:hypothetical protein